MPDTNETQELAISCFCGSCKHTFSVPKSSLPIPLHLCNCDISRRISGTLFTSYITVPADSGKPETTKCTQYHSSDILTRHFCSTCGTHMYLEYHHDGHFEAAAGTLQLDKTDGIVEYVDLMWVEDTKDGGASQFVGRVGDKELKRWAQGSGESKELPYDWKDPSATASSDNSPVRAHCHCNGVEFFVQRPSEKSKLARSGYADLIVPCMDPANEEKVKNKENEAWWLPNPERFLVGLCTCRSCRAALGFDVMSWAFIPKCDVTLDAEGKKPFIESPYWGKIKIYHSSEGVTRSFCGGCGAVVFWDGDEREGLIDVATALLDAPEGTRAESLLCWRTARVSFAEDAVNLGLLAGLETGMKAWAEKNEGRKCVSSGTLAGL
ncbi:hypothetical protein M011DRAFT_472441 [Sporormia fimetaria CBS 119925]|uniref:CENP-V/GFA domain-containing protein n=1 Tax=Sporormia fimetaria CBS 119925 TaxID=1340428 RepID=A0A6A6UXT3_9PLEO|nr:hypothetical protein M011DRAFT_472441 [Sporormia fimetaria CBS 119925]